MEEQEKKTRKSTSEKKTTTRKTAKPQVTKKEVITTAKKKKNIEKETVDSKITRKATPKAKEESKIEKEKNTVNVIKNKNVRTEENKATKTNEEKPRASVKNVEKIPMKKKTTTESQIKGEQPKEPKNIESKKRYIEISIGGIIAVVFIALLVILNISLGKKAYNMIKENNTTQNNVIDTGAEIEEKIGTVLSNKNEIVDKLIKKITFPINTTANIYKLGGFDENSVTDDIKLMIGWANLEETSKYHAKQANGETTISVEKAEIEKSIKEIFGEQVKYKDKSFDNTNAKEFSKCAETQGIIEYDGETYTGISNELEEAKVSFVYQEVQKVVKYEKEILVFAKAAFIKQEEDKYAIYQNYNEKVENKLKEIEKEDMFENITLDQSVGRVTIAVSNTAALNDIREELNTYKYVFEKDDITEEYYLKEFQKENV